MSRKPGCLKGERTGAALGHDRTGGRWRHLGAWLTNALSLQAGIDGEKEHAAAKAILIEIGELFQIQVGGRGVLAEGGPRSLLPCPGAFSFLLFCAQDDYLDLFGDPSVTGKVGTDIQDNKCSWLVVQCLQRASPEQRRVLQVPRGCGPRAYGEGCRSAAPGGVLVPQGTSGSGSILCCHNLVSVPVPQAGV